jgi:hypothetical protein
MAIEDMIYKRIRTFNDDGFQHNRYTVGWIMERGHALMEFDEAMKTGTDEDKTLAKLKKWIVFAIHKRKISVARKHMIRYFKLYDAQVKKMQASDFKLVSKLCGVEITYTNQQSLELLRIGRIVIEEFWLSLLKE